MPITMPEPDRHERALLESMIALWGIGKVLRLSAWALEQRIRILRGTGRGPEARDLEGVQNRIREAWIYAQTAPTTRER